VLLGAAFVLSLFCKLNARRFRFHLVFTLLVAALVAAKAVAAVAPTLAFNLHNFWPAGLILHAGYCAIAFGGIYVLQGYAFRRWRPRLKAGVAAAAAVVTGLLVEALVVRHIGAGEHDRMTELGLVVGDPASVGRSPEDLLFEVALSIAESDEARIKVLEEIENDRDSD
jgi:hypothetical protein